MDGVSPWAAWNPNPTGRDLRVSVPGSLVGPLEFDGVPGQRSKGWVRAVALTTAGRTMQRKPMWHVDVSTVCAGGRPAGSGGSSSARTGASRP